MGLRLNSTLRKKKSIQRLLSLYTNFSKAYCTNPKAPELTNPPISILVEIFSLIEDKFKIM